ncbi:oxidoreductase [Fructilactobacillus sp. Tb1]|uniref:oxidoreductase n=1 Tax=Fructilactobacillus sp. Tb1 TaxID=3422304 RepID=UPI003D26BAC0
MKTILITGASSGMGYQTAERLAKAGYQVFGAARHVEKMEPLKQFGVTPIVMDVTDAESRKQGVQQVLKQAGKIDVLVNAAGYGSFGALENVSETEAKRQFEVNVFGLVELTKLVLPSMKQRQQGEIINISSMAGRFSSPMAGWYFASKHTVETLSDSLRMEMKRFGIEVVLIEPGVIKSSWEGIAMKHLQEASQGTDYAKQAAEMKQKMDKIYASKLASQPVLIAKTIQKAIASRHPKARYLIGFMAKPTVWMNAILPTWLMDKIIPKFM